MTNNEIESYLRMIQNLVDQTFAVRRRVLDEVAAVLTDEDAEHCVNTLDSLVWGEITDIDTYIHDFLSAYLPDAEDGEPVPRTEVFVTSTSAVELRIPVDDKFLVPYTCLSDYGTVDGGVMYVDADKYAYDLLLAEVKKGALADNGNPDNEDIDLYMWGDAFDEDFTHKETVPAKNFSSDVREQTPVTEMNLRDNLLATIGVRAGHMNAVGHIKLDESVYGEAAFAVFAVSVVDKWLSYDAETLGDLSYDEYIEKALVEKYGVDHE